LGPLLGGAALCLLAACAALQPPVLRGAAGSAPSPPLEVAITLDDLTRPPFMNAPEAPEAVIERMLEVFARHHLPPVTGFLNGGTVAAHPEDRRALSAWLRAGNLLGNHTYSHADLARVGPKAFLDDVIRNEGVLESLAGPAAPGSGWRVFRYPYLQEGASESVRESVRAALLARGYRIAEVTVDFEDWEWFPAYERCASLRDRQALGVLRARYRDAAREALLRSDALARELFGRRVRQILLLHAGEFTAEMTEDLLDEYEQIGVRFIALDDALHDSAYHVDPRFARSYGSPFLYQVEAALHGEPPPEQWPPHPEIDALCR
jgi:peptidoglycan/xylan/chitin deacetylase (PgdA/CDA1 family)